MYFLEGIPPLKNQYLEDKILQSYLKRTIPTEILKKIEPGLVSLGERAVKEIYDLGFQAEAEEPVLKAGQVVVSKAWERLAEIAVEEKLVSTAFERNEGVYSRIHQMVRIYLFGPSSAIYTCPLAMSDGAARAIELYEPTLKDSYKKLISTDKKEFWTSGQWMTEKTGGSDVGQTSTVANKSGEHYSLYGTKWFTSATTSEMAMTLARIEGAEEGSRGLSLFYVKTRKSDGTLNNIVIHKLKDKMGTRALPTAELELQGTSAELVGDEGNGIKKISSLFNITRIWNACIASCLMRRGLAISKDFASQRFAFGKYLKDQPLHATTLADIQMEHEASFLLVMRISELLGKEELREASKEESLVLRILTPLAKLYTGKQAVAVSSEVIESIGGVGYMNDTGIPRLLKDTQVLSIWEGTTNVLSLDTLRAIQKEDALKPLMNDISRIVRASTSAELTSAVKAVEAQLHIINQFLKNASADADYLQGMAREFSFLLARTYMGALLIEHADWSLQNEKSKQSLLVANRWCDKKLVGFQTFPADFVENSKVILDIH